MIENPIKVLLVDDDPLARLGVANILRRDEGLAVVGEVADGDEVVAAFRRLRPHVVCMDIRMQRMSGIEATRLLMHEIMPPRVIALTAFNQDRYVIDALDAGATGFLLKDSLPDDFRRAIRTAVEGDGFIDPKSTKHVLGQLARRGNGVHLQQRRVLATLSDREREIARLIWQARSNPEIAERLYLGETTVKTHVSRVMQKLDCTSRVQVALLVERAGGLD